MKFNSLKFFDKYYDSTLVNKLSWYTYLNKCKHYNNLIHIIQNEFGKDVAIIIGDWSGKGSVHFMSTPNNYLKHKLKEYFTVYDINEYNTSKYHNIHHIKCKKLTVANDNNNSYINIHKTIYDDLDLKMDQSDPFYPKQNISSQFKTKKIHSILTFKKIYGSPLDIQKNNLLTNKPKNTKKIFCGKLNRDRNAVLNMKYILNHLLEHNTRPPLFCR